jgi:hypothetical protein
MNSSTKTFSVGHSSHGDVPEMPTEERTDAIGHNSAPFCEFSDASFHPELTDIRACRFFKEMGRLMKMPWAVHPRFG